MNKKYYEAYETRYQQVHKQNLSWFSSESTPIVLDTILKYFGEKSPKILDVGCGEGRDIRFLLDCGCDVTGIDISPEAIHYCKTNANEQDRHRFRVLDVCAQTMAERFDFIYSVVTLHMLLKDDDRKNYPAFLFNHLMPEGIGLILTMGDGTEETQSRAELAFHNVTRIHRETGMALQVAATSCRMVHFQTFKRELNTAGFQILETGMTPSGSDFPMMMYAIVRKSCPAI